MSRITDDRLEALSKVLSKDDWSFSDKVIAFDRLMIESGTRKKNKTYKSKSINKLKGKYLASFTRVKQITSKVNNRTI